jgi:hypothetical protein
MRSELKSGLEKTGRWIAWVLVAGLTGCSTVSVTPKSEVIERNKVSGSDTYQATNVQATCTQQGARDVFTLQADLIHTWQVEPQRRDWNEVIRRRYFLTSSDREYDAGMDLILDPIAGIFMVPISLCFYPFALCDFSAKGKDSARFYESVFLSVLPGVELAAWADTDTRSKQETLCRNERFSPLPTAEKTETTEWLDRRTIPVRGYDRVGKEIGRWQVVPGEPFAVPVCQLLLEGSEEPFSLELRAGSAQMPVQGQSRFVYPYDTAETVKRWLAENPEAGKRSAAVLSLDGSCKIDDALHGNGDGKITAGEKGWFVLQVKNSGGGNGYLISVESYTKDQLMQVGTSDTVALLRTGKGAEIRVPFEFPVDAPDGAASVRFCAVDAFSRRSQPVDVQVAYAHREHPDLVFGGAELSGSGAEDRDVLITLRNRGGGTAEGVSVELSSEPNYGQIVDKRVNAGDIPPYSKAQCRLRIKLPSGQKAGAVRFGITVHEKYSAVPRTYEVEVSVPVL